MNNRNHTRKSTVKLLGGALAALVLLGAGAAYAACDPACATGNVCRYDNGKYYCAPEVTKGKVKGAKMTSPGETGAPTNGKGAPLERAPVGPR
jgi:hypothetical protein